MVNNINKIVRIKVCCIYKITSPTGKIYIGQSTNVKRRFLDYKYFRVKKGSKSK